MAGWLVGWLVGWLASWLGGCWLVSRLARRMNGLMAGWLTVHPEGRLASRSAGRLVGWQAGRLVGWSTGWLAVQVASCADYMHITIQTTKANDTNLGLFRSASIRSRFSRLRLFNYSWLLRDDAEGNV